MSILGKTVDDSIFAWEKNGELDTRPGLLATSPDDFQDSGDIVKVDQDWFREDFVTSKDAVLGQYSLTGMGLELQADLKQLYGLEDPNPNFVLPLACTRKQKVAIEFNINRVIGIHLVRDFTPYIFHRISKPLLSYKKEDLQDINPAVSRVANTTINGRFWVKQQRPNEKFYSGPRCFIIYDDNLQDEGYTYADHYDSIVPRTCHPTTDLNDLDPDDSLTRCYSQDGKRQFDLVICNTNGRIDAWISKCDGNKRSNSVRVVLKKKAQNGIPFYEAKLHLSS